MRRKMLGAILLPLPFAALPVIVVLIGAVFGPENSGELVARETPTTISLQERVLTEATASPEAMARISEPLQFEPGCGDYDSHIES